MKICMLSTAELTRVTLQIISYFLSYFVLLYTHLVNKYLLKKAVAPYSSALARKSHGRRSLVGCSPCLFYFSVSCWEDYCSLEVTTLGVP